MNNQQLQNQIDELKKEVDNLKNLTNFPKEIVDILAFKLSDKEQLIDRTSTKTANIKSTIVLTGNPQSIDVPAFPDGFRTFNVGGKVYFIPYFNLS